MRGIGDAVAAPIGAGMTVRMWKVPGVALRDADLETGGGAEAMGRDAEVLR